MKCVMCKQGGTRPGKFTVRLEGGGATLVIPTRMSDNRGVAYVDEKITHQLPATA